MSQEWFLQSTADYGSPAKAKEAASSMDDLYDDTPPNFRPKHVVSGSKVKVYLNTDTIEKIGFNDDQLYEILYEEAKKKGINADELTLAEGSGFDESTENITARQNNGTITFNPVVRTETKTYVRHLMAHEISHYKDEKMGRGHKKYGKSCGGYVDLRDK